MWLRYCHYRYFIHARISVCALFFVTTLVANKVGPRWAKACICFVYLSPYRDEFSFLQPQSVMRIRRFANFLLSHCIFRSDYAVRLCSVQGRNREIDGVVFLFIFYIFICGISIGKARRWDKVSYGSLSYCTCFKILLYTFDVWFKGNRLSYQSLSVCGYHAVDLEAILRYQSQQNLNFGI